MARSRSIRQLCLSGTIALLALSVACRLDMLLKPTGAARSQLTVAPREVRDSARAGSHDIRSVDVAIDNDGGGSFTWTASDHSPWIQLDPQDGEAPGTLTISLDPEDLGPGVYEGDVTIVAREAGDSQFTTIAVTFVVQRAGLSVTPTSIEHSTNVNSNQSFNETLHVSNSGTGQLNWTASKSRPWVTLGATSGSGEGDIPVTINSSGLSGGTYHDDIVVTAPGALGSPVRVSVTLTVLAPGLAVNPSSIHESAPAGSTTPVTKNLHVSNSGNGAITWSATKHQPWVSLSQTSGGAPADVTVSLDPTGLPPGIQRDTIVFSSAEATNGSIEIPVEFEIVQPGLSVTPPSINATADAGDNKKQNFDLRVTNSGGGTLGWFASTDADWISVDQLGGIAPSTLTVTLDPRDLGAGTHTGNVTITSPGAAGSPFVVPVQLVISSKPCNAIGLDPDVQRPGTLDANDCEAPHRPGSFANVYSFDANGGDTYSIRLEAGFDAYLILSDFNGNVLAQNDECPGESGTACIREFTVPSGGRYFIEATSTAPGATGPLTITVVRERPPTPTQELRQLRSDGNTPIGIGETIPDNTVVFRGKVNDPNKTQAVRLEIELEPLGSPLTNVATHTSAFVDPGATTTVTAGGLTDSGYHWQARTCDDTGRCSVWLQFGNNAETDADFSVAVPPPGGSPARRP
ncbi:MAG: BACON domain-containing protein [Gemmatimonadales bacterium]